MNEKKAHIIRVLTSLDKHLYHDAQGYRVTNNAGDKHLSSYLTLNEVYIWIDGYQSERNKK